MVFESTTTPSLFFINDGLWQYGHRRLHPEKKRTVATVPGKSIKELFIQPAKPGNVFRISNVLQLQMHEPRL